MAENYPIKIHGQKSVQDAQVAVIMVPLSAHGHLNQAEQSRDSNKHHQTLDWLDKQEPDSVIYVSFGSSIRCRMKKSNNSPLEMLTKGDIFAGEDRRA
uniref:Zeatin O-glucosyltransferase ZOG4 n=1 Tax=Nicotiana attenuata TaxID=49451 RepID=A0A0A1WC53_NICAT